MAGTLLRKSSTQSASGAARIAWVAALQQPEARLLGDHAAALECGNGAVRFSSSLAVPGSHRPVSAGSALLGSTFRSVPVFSNVSLQRERGGYWSRGLISRSLYVDSVGGVQQFETKGNSGGEPSLEGSRSSGSVAVRPLQPSLSVDDFRSLIVRKKSEVALLEAALEILETAPRDKRFEDLVRKHNIQFEPVTQSVITQSENSVRGDVVKPNSELDPASTVEPTSQMIDSLQPKNDSVENNDSVGLEPAKMSYNQQDRSWNVAKLPSPKTDSSRMFGKLSLDNFPAPQDPNLERLQKKRRRLELSKEYERNNKIVSLNFGAAAKSAVGGSNPRGESPVDPLRPNASAFPEQPGEKTYKSLADRLYEEQFGHPAPPGLKRTYPKGSFYDRCMKEKEQKEREAARIASRSSASPPSSRHIEPSGVSGSSQKDEPSDNSMRKSVSSIDANQERKPGAWKCPECTFFNLAADTHCHRCQAQRGENGRRDKIDSGRRSTTERERA